jgi:hypothetical protein
MIEDHFSPFNQVIDHSRQCKNTPVRLIHLFKTVVSYRREELLQTLHATDKAAIHSMDITRHGMGRAAPNPRS